MSDDTAPCPHCAEPMPKGLSECPACGQALSDVAAPTAAKGAGGAENGTSTEVAERLHLLERWRAAAETFGVELPMVPRWVEARARQSNGEWIGFLDEVEQGARAKTLEALSGWEKRTLGRLQRLESYSIDGRLEREQVEDAVGAARAGEIARGLGVVQQVDRVITLKERHLEAARQELEHLTELVRDIRALRISVPYEPKELAEELEGVLREGRLAPLKQQLRALRLDIVRSLRASLPSYVARYGEFLAAERDHGRDVGASIAELARSAKAYSDGRPEEAVRRLKLLAEDRALPERATSAARPGSVGPTGPSRTA
ncbi:MAG: hypothetical protein L3J99_00095 [Thermoplasmata archaeon]|nr:hypothetical protein [Thermoplasmata archaeon]